MAFISSLQWQIKNNYCEEGNPTLQKVVAELFVSIPVHLQWKFGSFSEGLGLFTFARKLFLVSGLVPGRRTFEKTLLEKTPENKG